MFQHKPAYGPKRPMQNSSLSEFDWDPNPVAGHTIHYDERNLDGKLPQQTSLLAHLRKSDVCVRSTSIASFLLAMSWLDMLLNEGERAAHLRSDLPYFAEHCLKLRPKTGSLDPFVFNPAQLELHRRIEEQKAKTGRVRVIILKARQLGISSYLSARFFHRCLFEPGLRTFILGHERRASTNLFEMVKRMYEHLPEDVRPATGTFNAETLLFNNDSGYIVSVATLDGAGRSATAQLLHASEAAFWPDLEAQAASLFQIVPDTPGSEIAIETTANGYNEFHKLWRNAESSASEFMPVFLPWSLDPDYRKKPDEDHERGELPGRARGHQHGDAGRSRALQVSDRLHHRGRLVDGQ